MENIENLTDAELETALNSEIQALNGGTNPENITNTSDEEETTEEVETKTSDETEEEATDEVKKTTDEEPSENKTEKKIKKLLSQRNKEKKEKEGLSERLSALENELEDTKFYKDNPTALDYKDDIDKLISERDLTRDEAYILSTGKQLLAEKKKLNSNNNAMVGNTPNTNINGTDPSNMKMSDLDNLVKDMYNKGNFNI